MAGLAAVQATSHSASARNDTGESDFITRPLKGQLVEDEGNQSTSFGCAILRFPPPSGIMIGEHMRETKEATPLVDA